MAQIDQMADTPVLNLIRAREEAAVLRGVKAGLEAARRQVRGYADGCFACGNHDADGVCGDIDGILRALDPQAIAKETPDAY